MTKRGNSEGSISKRKDGRWEAAISLGDGRRRRFYGRTRGEAAEKLRKAQTALAQGLPLAGERLTVGEYLARWLEEAARPTLRPRVFQSYGSVVTNHLTPELGKMRLVKLTPDAIQAYMNRKLAGGLSPNTVRNHHAILRRALTMAERWGLVPRNVARLVSPPRAPREEVKPLTPEQAREFLDAVRGDRFEALYQIAIGLGLRQGEALGLTWEAVDLESGAVRVDRTLQRYDSAYHLDEVKTARSRRVIGLPRALVEVIKAHRTRQREDRLRAGAGWTGNELNLVFTTSAGAPLYSANVTRAFQKALADAGLPRQRFHDLRHAAASFMLAEGVSLKVAQEVLGHSTIAVTADIYSHVMPAATRDATERVGALLAASR